MNLRMPRLSVFEQIAVHVTRTPRLVIPDFRPVAGRHLLAVYQSALHTHAAKPEGRFRRWLKVG